MRSFLYRRAGTAAEAVALVAGEPQAAFLGGGTNLVDLMKLGVRRPRLLVDVTGLGLDGIETPPSGGLQVGASVRNSDLAAHPVVRRDFPLLARAVLSGASGQIRNMATVAGNLLQRTRCVYFQDIGKPCNKREPGTGCSARDGVNRDLAILGASPACIATHPSDLAVALAALDAIVDVLEPAGTRQIPLTELLRLPGDEPHRETTMDTGGLILGVRIPALSFSRSSTYRKARDRASFSFAAGSVAAAIDVEGTVIRDVRLAFGGVAPLPWRARAAEDALRGQPATRDSFSHAADVELAAAQPVAGNGFKVPLIRNLTSATLSDLAEGAP